MHFGRLSHIEGIDFNLPPDTIRTEKFLSLPRQNQTEMFIGCPIWASRHWVGSLYPFGTKSADFLKEYAKHFKTVEVNSTFYSYLDTDRIASWHEAVPPGFRFCPKVYRGITENLAGDDLQELIERFCNMVRAFQGSLGLTFAQFPESFGPAQGSLLLRFFKYWPQDVPLAVELRHRGWFKDHSLLDEAINALYRAGVATVITDTPGRRDVLHLSLTQPRLMIRFQGNELHPTDKERLDTWAKRLQSWSQHGLEEIYFFAHQPEDYNIPATAHLLMSALQAETLA